MKAKLTLFALLFTVNLFAQQLNIGDVINANIGNTYRGNLQWQVSHDNINWTDLAGETNPNLSYTITQLPTFVRAKTDEGTCQPVYSNTAIAQEQLTVTPPFNYTDSIMVTEYSDPSFANETMGLLSQILLPNNKGKVQYFGSHNSNGEPENVTEAKIYSANGDTVLNIKYDSAERIKAMYFSVNSTNENYIYSFNYGTIDTVKLKVFKVWWDIDSLSLVHEIGYKDSLDTLIYLYDASFKTDQVSNITSLDWIDKTSRLLNVLAIVAVTVEFGAPALTLCVLNPLACGIVIAFSAGLLLPSNSPLAQAIINFRPLARSPYAQGGPVVSSALTRYHKSGTISGDFSNCVDENSAGSFSYYATYSPWCGGSFVSRMSFTGSVSGNAGTVNFSTPSGDGSPFCPSYSQTFFDSNYGECYVYIGYRNLNQSSYNGYFIQVRLNSGLYANCYLNYNLLIDEDDLIY